MLVVRQAVVGPFAENTYLVACSGTRDALVIDPGGEVDRVLALAERDDFRIRRIFLTHSHIDHVAGAPELKRRLEAPVQLHAGDRDWLATVPRQAQMFGFEEAVEAVEIDHWHEDGEIVRVGDQAGRVIHTPGHSTGSCALFFPDAAVLFTGDTLFSGSVGRTDLPGGDFDQLHRSIVERIFPLGDEIRFHAGHGEGGNLGEERRNNPFVGEGARRGRFL